MDEGNADMEPQIKEVIDKQWDNFPDTSEGVMIDVLGF